MELLVLGVVVFTGLMVLGVVAATFSLVSWVLLFPFKLLALAFKGLALLVTLPIALLFGAFGALVFGVGLVILFLPALPFVLLVLLLIWLVRRNRPAAIPATR
jgi:hypothetical protein